jgi:hypothetical protein
MPTTEEIIPQGRTDPVKHLLTDATTPAEISTLLRCAVEVMNFEVLQYLLTTFKPDNGEWNFDRGIVREALSPGKANAFKLLCEFNSSILTTQLDHHWDPLAYAILGQNIPLAFLLTHGVDPNESELYYRPSIQAAARHGSCEMMALFLEHGARIDATDTLLAAMDNNRVDMLRFLVGPVLHLAVQKRDSRMVRILVNQFGANPLAEDRNWKTGIQLAKDVGDYGLVSQLWAAWAWYKIFPYRA